MVVNLCTLPPPPTGHMLRCSGLHLHGDEFVVYHHWLGVWRVPKRRWTLKKKKPPETLQTEHQPKIPPPPPPLSNCPWSAKSEGCAENLQKHKKDEEGENTEASVFWWKPTSAAPLSSGGWRQNHGMNKSSVTRAQTPFLEHGCADVCGIVQSPPTSPLSHLRTRKLLLCFQELTTPQRPSGNINTVCWSNFLKKNLKLFEIRQPWSITDSDVRLPDVSSRSEWIMQRLSSLNPVWGDLLYFWYVCN